METELLEKRIDELETRLAEYDRIFTQIAEAIEKAKENPMVANMMRAFGL